MSLIEKKNIDEIVCLGDIVGFYIPYYKYQSTRNAGECIRIIQENCNIVVAGNHDFFETGRIPDISSGFNYPDDWYLLDYSERKMLAEGKIWLHEENTLQSLISKKEKQFLHDLPEYKTAHFDDINILFSHFIHPDIIGARSDFYMKPGCFDSHLEFMKYNDCELSFSGHAHVQGVTSFSEKGIKFKSFGKTKIRNSIQGFLGPCIAKGMQSNGFIILDTKNMELDIVRIR